MEIDLELIKKEISKDRAKKQQVSEQVGINIPSDNFLHNLQQSLATGVPNKATAKLKVVNERSDYVDPATKKMGHNATPVNAQVLNELQNVKHPQQPQYRPPQQMPQNGASVNNEQYYNNLNETQQLINNNPTKNNAGVFDVMTQVMGTTNQGQSQQGMSPNYLVEQVNNAVHTYMQTNMNAVLEQAVKNTMMEIYEKEKIKIALEENKDLIGKIVIDTIVGLKKQAQKKNTVKK